jgi:hypothetical protein
VDEVPTFDYFQFNFKSKMPTKLLLIVHNTHVELFYPTYRACYQIDLFLGQRQGVLKNNIPSCGYFIIFHFFPMIPNGYLLGITGKMKKKILIPYVN